MWFTFIILAHESGYFDFSLSSLAKPAQPPQLCRGKGENGRGSGRRGLALGKAL